MSEDLTKKLPQSDSEKLTLILSTVQALTVRIERLEESRYETRPMWEKLVGDMAHLQESQDALRTEVRAMRRDIYYRFDILNNTLLAIQAENLDVHDRVNRLELNLNPPNTET